ncbi:MAG: tRNA (adenine(22)-N(1))-methyltransferase [Christensenellaceae bacterium]
MDRLEALAKFAEKGTVVADIGCDHGLLGKKLLLEYGIKKVIASDVSEASLGKAARLAAENGITGKMETRLGNGLCVLKPKEADTIVIAGMGGMQMIEILQQGEAVAKNADRLVLLPHRNAYELRKYLCQNGYRIDDEALALENGRYYQIIFARAGKERARDKYALVLGWKTAENNDPLLCGFLTAEIKKHRAILQKADGRENDAEYIENLRRTIEHMEGMLDEIKRR